MPTRGRGQHTRRVTLTLRVDTPAPLSDLRCATVYRLTVNGIGVPVRAVTARAQRPRPTATGRKLRQG